MFDRYATDEKRRTRRTVLLTLGGAGIALWAISGILSIGRLKADDMARLVPGEFGDLVPLAIVQSDGCFAAAFQISNFDKRPHGEDLLPELQSRRGGDVRYARWSSDLDFSGYVAGTELRDAAYSIGLGCTPGENSVGYSGGQVLSGAPVMRIWDIARDGKARVWHSFGEYGANPREYDDYFIGYVEESGVVVIGHYST